MNFAFPTNAPTAIAGGYRLRAPKVEDSYSGKKTKLDWKFATRTQVPGSYVLSSVATKVNQPADDKNNTTLILHVPTNSPVQFASEDRYEDVDGKIYTLEGELVAEVNPFTGWSPYAQVQVKRTTAT